MSSVDRTRVTSAAVAGGVIAIGATVIWPRITQLGTATTGAGRTTLSVAFAFLLMAGLLPLLVASAFIVALSTVATTRLRRRARNRT